MKYGKRLKNQYSRTAKDLGYSEEVIKALNEAKTEDEAIRIMETARHRSK